MRTYVHSLRTACSDRKRRAKQCRGRSGRVISAARSTIPGWSGSPSICPGYRRRCSGISADGPRPRVTRRPLLKDPRAVEIVDRLDYDFGDASRGAGWHAVRVATFDAAIRRFLARHPSGTVVALGEGLETQFWRVDNGRMRWISVDLPEALELRRKLLPEGPRQAQPRWISARYRLARPSGPGDAGAGDCARPVHVLPARAGA